MKHEREEEKTPEKTVTVKLKQDGTRDEAEPEPRYKQGIEEGKMIMSDCLHAAHDIVDDAAARNDICGWSDSHIVSIAVALYNSIMIVESGARSSAGRMSDNVPAATEEELRAVRQLRNMMLGRGAQN